MLTQALKDPLPAIIIRLPAALLAMLASVMAARSATAAGAAHGQELYESRCGGCHSLDANRSGRHIVASMAERLARQPTSTTRARSRTRPWSGEEKTLDAWLTHPQALIPGQRMNFRIALPEDRADIIAYLRQQSGR